MKPNTCYYFLLVLVLLFAASCGDKKTGNKSKASDYVKIEAIAAEFNPREIEYSFDVKGFEKIKFDLFGFDKDFMISYSPTLPANSAKFTAYTVSKGEHQSIGNYKTTASGTELLISEKNGTYYCSISAVNGVIRELDGTCYIKIHITLPLNLKAEVYNAGVLKSKMLFPISSADLLTEYEKTSFDQERREVLSKFKESHRITGKQIKLTSAVLGRIIHRVSFDKLSFLRDLHSYVQDRENLGEMIDKEFTHFDAIEARRIVI
ncbi:MAG TPA: DUF4476 domain-containing protein [Bacteriovoracaceae bacterium]|nr:DUF4476 domain-containing protein [Bacteriovoracaceae bacterium]